MIYHKVQIQLINTTVTLRLQNLNVIVSKLSKLVQASNCDITNTFSYMLKMNLVC